MVYQRYTINLIFNAEVVNSSNDRAQVPVGVNLEPTTSSCFDVYGRSTPSAQRTVIVRPFFVPSTFITMPAVP